MSESGDNVTRFPIRPKRPDGRTLKIVESYSKQGCQHTPEGNTYLVDQSEGTVHCGKCDTKLDPLWVMLQLANKESHWYYNWERYAKVARAAEKRIRTKCQHCGQMTRISR